MRIVAVQLDIAWHDRPANHRRVRALLDGAPVAPGALVVLPEMFDVGFSMDRSATDPGESSASEAFCKALARDTGAAVLAGVAARTREGGLANEAIAIAPDGRELCRYRKMRPFTLAGEHAHHAAGTAHATFDWQGMRVAPFICYDLRFPELFRPAAAAGAGLLVVVANWPERRADHWDCLLRARAIENQAYVLGVNRCGTDPNLRYDGRSALIDPMGQTVVRAADGEQVFSAEADPAIVHRWRADFPALVDMRPF